MSHRLHILLHVILGFAALLAPMVTWILSNPEDRSSTEFFVVGTFGFLLLVATSAIFTKYVPAHCKHCGGRSYCVKNQPVTFKCQECSREYVSKFALWTSD